MPLEMLAAPKALGGRTVFAVALAAASVALCVGDASATPAWIKRAFSAHARDGARGAAAPPVARYRIDEGGVFTLDLTATYPLMKFDDSPEVWALTASRGPRGDMIYSNDVGQALLRTTRLGGVTVFTRRRPTGAAAALAGGSTAFRLATIGAVGLYQRLLQASLRSSHAAGRLISFEAPDADAATDGLIADAALVASEAIVGLCSHTGGKAVAARVARIEIERGKQPGALLRGAIVMITIAPSQGLAGRPSSVRILRALGAR